MRRKKHSDLEGFEFKRWRKNRLRLTAAGVASLCGVSLAAVNSWEQGRNPVPAYAEKLLKAYEKETAV